MEMSEAMQAELDRSVLCWLATASANGVPNVSPKEIYSAFSRKQIVIADIASPVSVRNIRENPQVCVSFIDIFRQQGFKVSGVASLIAPDEDDFSRCGADLFVKAGPEFRIRHIILVSIERVARIKAPSYVLYPDRTEGEMMRDAYRSYGVEPVYGQPPKG